MQIDENDILTEKQKVTAYVIIFVTLNSFSLIIASFEWFDTILVKYWEMGCLYQEMKQNLKQNIIHASEVTCK